MNDQYSLFNFQEESVNSSDEKSATDYVVKMFQYCVTLEEFKERYKEIELRQLNLQRPIGGVHGI